MLNISKERISGHVDKTRYQSLMSFTYSRKGKYRKYIFSGMLLLVLGTFFLPWTQNILSKGYVTSLHPAGRPQGIPALIPGRIEKWYVNEGDFVKKGDTIIHISEIKDEYFDPQLLNRTRDQIISKEATVQSYMEKVKALDSRIDALNQNLGLSLEQKRNKLRQAKLKVLSDSMELSASQANYSIALEQNERMEKLYEQGLKSKTELEGRSLKLQEARAKMISQENKLISSRNEVLNARIEINSTAADYREKINKAESEKFSSLSSMYDSEAELSKMQNRLSNYNIRKGFYYITAPQDGYITRATRSGIGETISEGEKIVTIMPANYQLAVEMFVRPLDLPLIGKGQEVRIQFDGWPAIVFRGWPGVSTGTYEGKIVAIENFSSKDGLFRVLVAPDPDGAQWPDQIRVGSGAKTFTLLKDVPIWYEIWRQINGFPPDYYPAGDPESPKIKDQGKNINEK